MRSILKILYLNQTAEAVLRFNKEEILHPAGYAKVNKSFSKSDIVILFS